jgi:Protein of unknown function (DUF2510)
VSLRSKLADRARRYLEPGEQLQAIFMAQSGPSPYWGLLTPIMSFFSKFHQVVATDRAILVLDASMWTPARPRQLRMRRPRDFYFGRLSGLWGSFVLDNRKYWVHRRFHKDVAAADAALTEMTQGRHPGPAAAAPVEQQPRSLPPAGWYPDPSGGSAQRYWDGNGWAPPAQQARPY